MEFISEWAKVATEVKNRAESRTCGRCESPMTIGYSNLGIPVQACPSCMPGLVRNGQRPCGEAWGIEER